MEEEAAAAEAKGVAVAMATATAATEVPLLHRLGLDEASRLATTASRLPQPLMRREVDVEAAAGEEEDVVQAIPIVAGTEPWLIRHEGHMYPTHSVPKQG